VAMRNGISISPFNNWYVGSQLWRHLLIFSFDFYLVTPKLSDEPLSNVRVKLAVRESLDWGGMVGGVALIQQEQIFNWLAKKHGFGDPFQLQYVNSLDSLVPADAFTQEIQAQFPSLDVKSFL
jgi:hypothetical protein